MTKGSEPQPATYVDEGRVDFPVARLRLTGLFLATLAFVALCGAPLLINRLGGKGIPPGSVEGVALLIGLAFFGLGAVMILRQLLRRGPVVSVSSYGIFDRRLTSDWIPWTSLDRCDEVHLGKQGFLRLVPRPGCEGTLPWTLQARCTAWLNRVIGGGYWLPGQGVKGGTAAILAVMSRVRRTNRPGGQSASGPSPRRRGSRRDPPTTDP